MPTTHAFSNMVLCQKEHPWLYICTQYHIGQITYGQTIAKDKICWMRQQFITEFLWHMSQLANLNMLMYNSFFGSSYLSKRAITEKIGGKIRKMADTHKERAMSLRMYTETCKARNKLNYTHTCMTWTCRMTDEYQFEII